MVNNKQKTNFFIKKHFKSNKCCLIYIMIDFKKERIQLVKKLLQEHRILTSDVKESFLKIPRELFVQESQKKYAYQDRPLSINYQQTISAPHMVAIMVEALDLKKGQKVLEIGAGSGYHAAITSELIGNKGHIYSIERIKELAEFADHNLKKAGISNVTIICSDGSIGLKDKAPFDRIYVTCAAPSIPDPYIGQLKNNGYLLIPIGDHFCDLQRIQKKDDQIEIKHYGSCAFVPLIGQYGF